MSLPRSIDTVFSSHTKSSWEDKQRESSLAGSIESYNRENLIYDRTARAMLGDGRLKGKKFAGRWHVAEEWLQELFLEPDSPSVEEV